MKHRLSLMLILCYHEDQRLILKVSFYQSINFTVFLSPTQTSFEGLDPYRDLFLSFLSLVKVSLLFLDHLNFFPSDIFNYSHWSISVSISIFPSTYG
jgi:hypothetical protein